MGKHQSDAARERPAGQGGKRQGRARGQHGDHGAHPRAERQQPALGRGPGDGAAVAAGGCAGRRHSMARSLPRRQEAGARHPVCPRRPQTPRPLPRVAQGHARHRRLPPAGGGATGAGEGPGRSTVAGHGLPLPAADRTGHRPNRAQGPGRRGGAGRRQAGQPVRAARRYHRQG